MHTIDHIGILVSDLEESIARWSDALRCDFSPIGRYRSANYVDTPDGVPHAHDARFSVSRTQGPYVELLEAVGIGSHSPQRLGFHHLAIRVPDAHAEVERLGSAVFACSREPNGLIHICFTDPADLDLVSLEFISDFPGPILKDDGSPAWRDPVTGRASLWGPE